MPDPQLDCSDYKAIPPQGRNPAEKFSYKLQRVLKMETANRQGSAGLSPGVRGGIRGSTSPQIPAVCKR
ncbi:hypothetical protein V6N12_042810 [Hibiscus sabdariffa]|uniref:Uncharacterized protein n=1 Tax=Hibiscus sabdariffa TaxID=183260 RepID=A0ABR2AU29_9ROSI